MTPEDLKIRARRLVEEVLNQGDLAVANELMSPTCVHHVPGGELAPGPASLRDWLSRTLRIFPDFHAIVEDAFAAGDQVALRITAYGTHQGTGRPGSPCSPGRRCQQGATVPVGVIRRMRAVSTPSCPPARAPAGA
jgi:hypothetical protein